MNKENNRNQFVDIMRGIAMLLVVLDHTMTGCTIDSQKSFLFNIVWSLQMPLFILISGYVTKYSRILCNKNDLWSFIKKRTVSYMLPWCVWSFFVRGFIFNENSFFDIKRLLFNMDTGYWFLATIWIISLIFGFSSYFSQKLVKDDSIKKQVVFTLFYLFGMFLLCLISLFAGFSFFALKLTLYYMPFYYCGYLYGQFDEKIFSSKYGKKIVDSTVAICFIIWLIVILRYSIFELPDNNLYIIIRAFTSLCGCIGICGLLKPIFANDDNNKNSGGGVISLDRETFNGSISCPLLVAMLDNNQKCTDFLQSCRIDVNSNKLCSNCSFDNVDYYNSKRKQSVEYFVVWKVKIKSFFLNAGERSLEIYLLHGLVLNLFKTKSPILFNSIEGYLLTFMNFMVTVLLCFLIITLLCGNRNLRKIFNIR